MNIIKKAIAVTAFVALIAPVAHAVTPDCTDDKSGTMDPIINLYDGCIVESDQLLHPNSVGQANVRLLSANLDALNSASSQDVQNAITKLVIFVGGLADNGIQTF